MFIRELDDDQTAEQTTVESAATVDTNTDGLTTETDETDAAPLAGQADESATEDSADDSDIDSETAGQTAAGDSATESETDSNATTFSRAYVEKLRRENAGYRERAQRADELAARLHTALVAATGRMADPTDLAFDAAHLDDEQALSGAIDELLTRKPHLASRRPFGDVGQGNRGGTVEPVNLADMLRARA